MRKDVDSAIEYIPHMTHHIKVVAIAAVVLATTSAIYGAPAQSAVSATPPKATGAQAADVMQRYIQTIGAAKSVTFDDTYTFKAMSANDKVGSIAGYEIRGELEHRHKARIEVRQDGKIVRLFVIDSPHGYDYDPAEHRYRSMPANPDGTVQFTVSGTWTFVMLAVSAFTQNNLGVNQDGSDRTWRYAAGADKTGKTLQLVTGPTAESPPVTLTNNGKTSASMYTTVSADIDRDAWTLKALVFEVDVLDVTAPSTPKLLLGYRADNQYVSWKLDDPINESDFTWTPPADAHEDPTLDVNKATQPAAP